MRPAPTLAKLSRPRLFEHDSARTAVRPPRRSAGACQSPSSPHRRARARPRWWRAGSRAASWGHLVPGGCRRRRSGHVLPFPRHRRARVAGTAAQTAAAATAHRRSTWRTSTGSRGASFASLYARLKAPATWCSTISRKRATKDRCTAVLLCAIDEVPRGVHLFLVSRHPPPDRYARLAANRSMALVDWDAIKLTADETDAIVGGGTAARRGGDGLAARTLGGWAAGLVLLAEQFPARARTAIGRRSGLARAGLRLLRRPAVRPGPGRRIVVCWLR